MPMETIARELLDLEHQYWRAIQEKDIDTMLRLTADPCIVTGAQGIGSLGHAVFRQMMQHAPWSLQSFEIGDDVQVRVITENVAVIAYTVREQLLVDGAPLALEAADSSTWVRRDGGWVCVVHTEALRGDPFGRDRKPVHAEAHA